MSQQVRSMGGAAHGNPKDYVTYGGLTLKKRSGFEYGMSKLLGGTMWFWIFYQFYSHYDQKVHGLPAMFEAEGLDEDDEGHGHH